jgi:hypothetical protein
LSIFLRSKVVYCRIQSLRRTLMDYRIASFLLALSFISGSAFGADTVGKCVEPNDWHTKADADRDRVYVNRNGDVFFFEYTPEGDGSSLQGNPFWVSMPSEPNARYDLSTGVSTGNGTDFKVKIQGAVDDQSGKPIEFTLKGQSQKNIHQKVRATGKFIDVYVRGEHVIKFWSYVGPTKLCQLK